MSKLLTVVGATGNQGGSVVDVVLSHPTLSKQFRVRGLTRDPSKPAGQALAAKGVEVVAGDINDQASLEKAFAGSYAVFAVTNFWESQSRDIEEKQGRAMADAAKAAGAKHFLFSALPDTTKMTNGKLSHISHFDGKAAIAEYAESIKGDMVTTYPMPGFYMSNVKGSIRPDQSGVPTYAAPWNPSTSHVPMFDTADTGKYVGGILLQDPQSVNGKYINMVSQWRTPREIVDTISAVSGTKVEFRSVPAEVFQSFLPAPVAEELTENFVLVGEYSYYGPGAEQQQTEHDRVLGDMTTTTWEDYIRTHGPWQWS